MEVKTKLLCKSSLGLSVRLKKTSHLRETTERTDLQRYDKKARLLFFLSVLPFFVKSVLNIKVSIYKGAAYTEQQGQKKVERTKGSKSRNFQKLATTLRRVLLVRNDVKIFLLCCCSSNNTISTTFLPLPETHQDKVATAAEASILNITLTACLKYFSFPTGIRQRRCFSSSAQDECSHCEQQ